MVAMFWWAGLVALLVMSGLVSTLMAEKRPVGVEVLMLLITILMLASFFLFSPVRPRTNGQFSFATVGVLAAYVAGCFLADSVSRRRYDRRQREFSDAFQNAAP